MKLFQRPKPTSPELAAALALLDEVAEQPALREAAQLQAAILRAIYADPPPVGALAIGPERASEKLRDGVPLLRGEPLPIDLAAARALLLRLCRVAAQNGADRGAAEEIAAAIGQGALDVPALVGLVLAGDAAEARARAAQLGLDAGLFGTLLRFCLFPALAELAAQAAPLRAAAAWGRGYCPICGSWPLLGEYRGLDQARLLRCGLCASEWTFDRMCCPFCESRRHQDLGYLHVEGQEQQRASTCERCHGYIKTLATLAAIPPAELPARDLATIFLDMAALERGYAALV